MSYADQKVKECEDVIKAAQAKIKQIEAEIQEALQDRIHDPWKYDRQLKGLIALKYVELERIALMADRARSERPTGDDYRPSGAVWLPRGY
jgi:hypothetical protein